MKTSKIHFLSLGFGIASIIFSGIIALSKEEIITLISNIIDSVNPRRAELLFDFALPIYILIALLSFSFGFFKIFKRHNNTLGQSVDASSDIAPNKANSADAKSRAAD